MKKDLQGAAASALAQGSSQALVVMAFLAVLREGFETAVFLLATFHASGDASTSWPGAVLGIVLAAAIGYGIYKGGVKLNLARFFRVTGLVLVVVAVTDVRGELDRDYLQDQENVIGRAKVSGAPLSGGSEFGDALNEYIHHTGSAVFAVPPGLRPGQHWDDALFT